MCKYEMDLASIVEVTERTRFGQQTDGPTDGWADRRTEGQTKRRKGGQSETSIPPQHL